jgi:uncharacterized protein YdaT
MSEGKEQHVTPHPDGWQVKAETAKKATQVFPTQKEAIDKATEIAKNQQSEVVIHRKDGTIRNKNSYGNDPNPPKDTKH